MGFNVVMVADSHKGWKVQTLHVSILFVQMGLQVKNNSRSLHKNGIVELPCVNPVSGRIRLVGENLFCSQKGYAMSIVVFYDYKSWMGHSCNDMCHCHICQWQLKSSMLYSTYQYLIGAFGTWWCWSGCWKSQTMPTHNTACFKF
jgi:hypothetical protein